MREPPDLPRRDPTPSIAAFPFCFDSRLSGIKAISFVASNSVYLEARAKVFWSAPKKTAIMIGVLPAKRAGQFIGVCCKRVKRKNNKLVAPTITGVNKAANVQ